MSANENVQRHIAHLGERRDLSRLDARQLFESIMTGAASDAQIGGALMALKLKGETVDEIVGAVEAMRALSEKVSVDLGYLVDTCGTGGSGSSKLFNISTAAAFVAAAAGAHVAKHGNRGMTSKSGSADVLEAAGVNLNLTPAQIARCIGEVGVGFMFAPSHHRAMKHAAGARRDLGTRTIFNLVAPLTNPACAQNQVIGVFAEEWLEPLAHVLNRLGSDHVMLVHANGLDELSISGPSDVAELRAGKVTRHTVHPSDFGIDTTSLEGLYADSPAASLVLLVQSLNEPDSAAAQIVALNAGAAIYVSGVAISLANGVTMAQDAIASGLANERFEELVRITSLMNESR